MQERAGPAFNAGYIARGLAAADFDNDGRIDVVFTLLVGTPVLLRNNNGHENQWIGFELQGTKSNREAIGAKMTVVVGNLRMVRWITGGSGYLSSRDKRVVFGLVPHANAKTVSAEIRWPTGALQQLSDLKANQYHKVVETFPSTLPVTPAH